MLRWVLLFFCLWNCIIGYGQDTTAILTASQRDSIQYTNLKKKFYKRKITRGLYDLFFNDIYNRSQKSEVKVIETNPFDIFDGKIIGSITFKQLNVLGASVYDTTRKSNKFQSFISSDLHTNTKERFIRRSLLLFKEGDPVRPQQLKENERILRQSPVLVDARIILTERINDPETVDMLIITQDVWSIDPKVSFSGLDNFGLGFENKNVRGLAHSNLVNVRWRQIDTLQQLGFRTIYTIPYLGKTFISSQAGFIWERDLKQQFLRVSRPFLTVETKYAGALELGIKEIQEYKKSADNLQYTNSYAVRNRYYDMWIGRAFRLSTNWSHPNTRFITALRHTKVVYAKRPEVTADSNKIYWNTKSTLLSIGFSDRNYKRDLLIYGFGRTEDVPIGSLFTLTLGNEDTEFGRRGYAGMQFSTGKYIGEKGGYVHGIINTGSYIKTGRLSQSIINTNVNYFTPLMRLGLSQVRQFVNLRFTKGYRMDALEYVNITDIYGIRGIYSDQLIGTKRLNLSSEVVLFSPGSFLGFRGAHFVYTDLAWVNTHKKLWQSKLYQSFGIGIRLRNEHLTFNTVEIRLSYYGNIPTLHSNIKFDVQGVQTLRLPDFDISAPQIVPFR